MECPEPPAPPLEGLHETFLEDGEEDGDDQGPLIPARTGLHVD